MGPRGRRHGGQCDGKLGTIMIRGLNMQIEQPVFTQSNAILRYLQHAGYYNRSNVPVPLSQTDCSGANSRPT